MGEPTDGCFKFRISDSYDTLKSKIDTFFAECEYLAVYQHEADDEVSRTHIHGVCKGFNVKSVKTFRQRMQKAFDLDGNRSFSVGDIGPKPFEYCSKGRYDPVFFKGFTKEYIDEKKNEGYDGKKDRMCVKDGKIVIERDVKTELKEKGKTDIEMIEELAKRCNTNDLTEPRDIAEEILKCWNKNRKRGHARLMVEWIDAVRYYMPKQRERWLDECVNRYEKNISR